MNKMELIKRYNNMVQRIKDAKIYDGRGTIDVYRCDKCGEVMLTTYKEKGVTPFICKCNKCKDGWMRHTETFPSEDVKCNDTINTERRIIIKQHEVLNWVRPNLTQFLFMRPELQEHILNGGLVLETKLSK